MSVAMEAGNRDVGVLLYAHEERHKSSSVGLHQFHLNASGSRAASFKRPLLSVDVSLCVCLSANLMLNISETKEFGCSCPGAYRKVPTARRLVTL